MTRILVLTSHYPTPEGGHERMFVHVRNKYYLQQGIDLDVLNFASRENYTFEGINVICYDTYKNSLDSKQYDVLVVHSANIRNHFLFLIKYGNKFKKTVFFFHGHEVLYLNKDYPKAYGYVQQASLLRHLFQNAYDKFKLLVWHFYYPKVRDRSFYVFVSQWIYEHFFINTRIDENLLKSHCYIINNSIGKKFEHDHYDKDADKQFDFISIRSNIDGSKYCVDLYSELAVNNPNKKFLLIGKGQYFDHYHKPGNLYHVDRTISHEEMIDFLNASKCAIMLTRQDTQGVMACEMATFGIPLITSDIEVCHEIFEGFENVALIDNSKICSYDLDAIMNAFTSNGNINKKYYADNTIKKELDIICGVVGSVESA